MKEEFYQKVKGILSDNQILIEEPLAKHTTFHIGGPAWFLLLPETLPQVAAAIKLCRDQHMPFYVLGNGSNLIVSDKGYDGTIVKISQALSEIFINEIDTFKHMDDQSIPTGNKGIPADECNEEDKEYLVRAQAGVLLSKLSKEIAEYGLTGFEFAAGIPGTLGGAVTMNAGAYDGDMKHAIVGAVVLDVDGNILKLNKEELKLGYRKSIIQEKKYIVLEASFCFKKGNKEAIKEKIIDLNTRRSEKQPLEFPSAGSTFKRPEGYYAAKLIMDSGLRGYQVGNAQISEKHCGFVINKGSATAVEVLTLINDVIRIVNEKFGVILEPEVKLLGDF